VIEEKTKKNIATNINAPDSFIEDINKFDEFFTSYEYADDTIKKTKEKKNFEIELNDNKVILKDQATEKNNNKTKSRFDFIDDKFNVNDDNEEYQNINAILDKYRYTGI
jgi:hypothetical protein